MDPILKATLDFIKKEFGIAINQSRIDGWVNELQSGTGRTADELRRDIFIHVITPARIQEWVRQQFQNRNLTIATGNETEAQRLARITNELVQGQALGGRNFNEFIQTLDSFAPPTQPYTGVDPARRDAVNEPNVFEQVRGITPNAGGAAAQITQDASPAAPPQGSSANYPGVLGGGKIIQVTREGQDDTFWMVYEYPPGSGNRVAYQFDGLEQIEQTFGPNWQFRIAIGNQMDEETFMDTVVIGGSAAGQIIGIPGTFAGMAEDMIAEQLRAAGIGDPTIAGQILQNQEIQTLLFNSSVGGWSDERLLGALRDTSFWKDVYYPGIERFYGVTDSPEQMWNQYFNSVSSNLSMLGYEPSRELVGDMISTGVSAVAFNEFAPTFLRAQRSTDYANVLNQWTNRFLGSTIDFDTWYNVLAGQAPADLMEVVEAANFQFAAETRGFEITAAQIESITQNTNLSAEQASQIFSDVERQLLALGDRGLGRSGLSVADLLQAKAGIKTADGRSPEEIQLQAQKIAIEEGLLDDPKIKLFIGFDSSRGVPQRPGLLSLSPERG